MGAKFRRGRKFLVKRIMFTSSTEILRTEWTMWTEWTNCSMFGFARCDRLQSFLWQHGACAVWFSYLS